MGGSIGIRTSISRMAEMQLADSLSIANRTPGRIEVAAMGCQTHGKRSFQLRAESYRESTLHLHEHMQQSSPRGPAVTDDG